MFWIIWENVIYTQNILPLKFAFQYQTYHQTSCYHLKEYTVWFASSIGDSKYWWCIYSLLYIDNIINRISSLSICK